jgi:hypothetical protein
MQVTQLVPRSAAPCRTQLRNPPSSALPAQRLCARPGGNGLVCSPAAAHEVRQRLQVAAASATLDDLSASTADGTEGEAQPSSAPAAGTSQLDDVPLTSEVCWI